MQKSAKPRRRKKLARTAFAALAARQGAACGICGQPMRAGSIHVDHIVPVSRGGSDATWNLRLSHKACNLKRGNRP
ncbi:MAG TPA: HNH endonuclease signature motif containing protein [Rubrivivax sp.]|nr:HNH endonuclease signature motif containing protein [Rubrivivax sp.]HMR72119.1 HNH endonuclease signature motif containing protein [Rubrivivax sp.]